MTKRMLIDAAHSEEVRVVVINDDRIEDFEVETSDKEQIKGNIYVAEVTRVEPSLQAAFVNYGGNRNGFLAFSEIHPQYFDLPAEEKEALLQELTDIAAKRKGRDTEAEERLEAEVAAKEEARAAKADAKEAANQDNADAVNAEEVKKTRGRKSKAAKEAEAKAEAEAKELAKAEEAKKAIAEETPESLDGLTPEEMEEDARALALASSIIIDDQLAPVEDEPRKRRGRPTRKPKRHSKYNASDDVDATSPAMAEKVTSQPSKANDDADDTVDDIIENEVNERRQPIHRRYNIKDVLKEGSKILIQINKEERGNKGAAVSTYISLPGRYSVLMPNTPYAGGISRKITDFSVRRKIKSIVNGLNIPDSMGVIIRTAGVGQEPENIEKDVTNMLTLWTKIEEQFKSNVKAPQVVHEDGNLSIRAIRDMFKADVDEVNIAGYKTYRTTKEYIKNLMPEFASKVKEHKLQTPLFSHYGVEEKLNRLHTTRVNLPSGGYLIINPTEALVSVDVNSGKATQEKNIEETALKTNLEAAEEMARQLRLRDLAGLIVIDFIDMEDNKNEKAVERMMRKCIRKDRARIQIAPISTFGLLEMSRQRLRPSLGESTTHACKHCNGTGVVASLASAALTLLRSLEDENVRTKADKVIITTSDDLALYILNEKRELVKDIENRYKFTVYIRGDAKYDAPDHSIEVTSKDARGIEKHHITEVILREPLDDGEYVKPTRRRGRKNKNEAQKGNEKHADKHAKNAKHSNTEEKGKDKSASEKSETPNTQNENGDKAEKGDKKQRRSGGRVRHLRRGTRRDENRSEEADDKSKADNNAPEKAAEQQKNDNKSPENKAEEKKPTRRGRTRKPRNDSNKDERQAAAPTPQKESNDTPKEPSKIKEKQPPRNKPKADAKPTPSKGIIVEHINDNGKSSVSNTQDASVGGKFQRWWNKTTS